MNKTEKLSRIIFTSASIGWMTAIFLFSAQNSTQSSNLSGGFIRECLSAFAGFNQLPAELQQKYIAGLQDTVRTCAHGASYALLGILVSAALISYRLRSKVFVFSILICFLYALTDEFHQYFVPGRAMQAGDVAVDLLGAVIGTILCIAFARLIRKIAIKRPNIVVKKSKT